MGNEVCEEDGRSNEGNGGKGKTKEFFGTWREGMKTTSGYEALLSGPKRSPA